MNENICENSIFFITRDESKLLNVWDHSQAP